MADLEQAEKSIREAVHAAERMAKVEVQSVIVNHDRRAVWARSISRPASICAPARWPFRTSSALLAAAAAHSIRPGRAVLHAIPTGYALDTQSGVTDPRGLMGRQTLRRHACGVGRSAGGSQSHARGRALPSRYRGGHLDALRIGPVGDGR